jgi:PAS domain-containing protein
MLAEPSVTEDGDAVRLLRGVAAACEVLTLNIGNVLSLGRLDAPPRVEVCDFALTELLSHAVALICGTRVAWVGDGTPAAALGALPERVRGDRHAVALCVQNTLLTLARMLVWEAPEAPLQVDARCTEVTPSASAPSSLELHVLVVAPGVTLTDAECEALITPFGVTPVRKGDVNGLPLFLAHRAARALGGDLALDCSDAQQAGISVRLRLPLQLARPGGIDARTNGAATLLRTDTTGTAAAQQQQQAVTQPLPPLLPAELPPRMTELEVSQRMFSFLVENSDDLFLICELSPSQPTPTMPASSRAHAPDGAARVVAASDAQLVGTSMRIAYASPNVTRLLGVSPAQLHGRDAAEALIAAEDARRAGAAMGDAAAAARRAPGWLTHVALCMRVRGVQQQQEPLWMDGLA